MMIQSKYNIHVYHNYANYTKIEPTGSVKVERLQPEREVVSSSHS